MNKTLTVLTLYVFEMEKKKIFRAFDSLKALLGGSGWLDLKST